MSVEEHTRYLLKKERTESETRGIVKGRIEGREEEKEEIASNLLQMGMNPNDISKATGLKKEEIYSLRTKAK